MSNSPRAKRRRTKRGALTSHQRSVLNQQHWGDHKEKITPQKRTLGDLSLEELAEKLGLTQTPPYKR